MKPTFWKFSIVKKIKNFEKSMQGVFALEDIDKQDKNGVPTNTNT